MSYEGWTEHICSNGHRFCKDAHDHDNSCTDCGENSIWSNEIDDTNGEEFGIIPEEFWDKFLISQPNYQKCQICNNVTHHEPAKYKIPNDDELKELRHFRVNGVYKLCNNYSN